MVTGSATTLLALCVALVLAPACATPMSGGASFVATYVPGSSPLAAPGVPGCATFAKLSFLDGRADRSVVGERFREGKPGRWSIGMQGDPVPMLEQAADRTLRAAAMLPNPAAPYDLRIALVSVFMEEKHAFNSTYRAVVVLETTVLARDSGAVVWSVRHTGEGKNYGRSGSAINYQETVSRALNTALPNALGDPALHQVLCQPPGSPGNAPLQPGTPEAAVEPGALANPTGPAAAGPKVAIEALVNVPESLRGMFEETSADALRACQVAAAPGTGFLVTVSVVDVAEVQGLDAASAQCVGQRITDRVRSLVQQGTYVRANGSKVGTIRVQVVE